MNENSAIQQLAQSTLTVALAAAGDLEIAQQRLTPDLNDLGRSSDQQAIVSSFETMAESGKSKQLKEQPRPENIPEGAFMSKVRWEKNVRVEEGYSEYDFKPWEPELSIDNQRRIENLKSRWKGYSGFDNDIIEIRFVEAFWCRAPNWCKAYLVIHHPDAEGKIKITPAGNYDIEMQAVDDASCKGLRWLSEVGHGAENSRVYMPTIWIQDHIDPDERIREALKHLAMWADKQKTRELLLEEDFYKKGS